MSSIRAQSSDLFNEEESVPCPNGGTASIKSQIVAKDSTSGTITLDMTYSDCGVTVILKEKSYAETLNGSGNVSGAVKNDYATASGGLGLTISGDLGLSLECSASASGPIDAEVPDSLDGQCVFRDSEGTELIISKDELLSLN